jgi:hypothetical protein
MRPPSTRTFVPLEAAQQLREAQLLVESSHRVRPRYFDGKFLAARDLTRDQAYFLARQAGYARALGAGVVQGLDVRAGAVATDLEVDAGMGYTASGELVSLNRLVRVSLPQLFRLQTLAAQLQTLRRPGPPLRNRTGVFVLGLRAIEFAANPLAAYPSSLDGARQAEEGDIVEAGALTLAHWVDAPPDGIDLQRGRLARDAFVTQSLPPLPAELLPLAAVAVVGDAVRWVDMHLVRRAAGQTHTALPGLGFAPRPQREAHLAQYVQQLAEITARSLQGRPSAAQWFQALPPAGPLPTAALDPADFSQSWFPPGVGADLMLVPEDEVPALLDESLLLPPIDLQMDADAQASTAVALLVTVPRHLLAAAAARLRAAAPTDPRPALQRPVASPALQLGAKRLPLQTLRLLTGTRLAAAGPPPAPAANPRDAVWAELLARQDTLWYVRRRNLGTRPELEGTPVALSLVPAEEHLPTGDAEGTTPLPPRLREDLQSRASVYAVAEITRLLDSPRLAGSPLLAEATVALLAREERIGMAEVARVAELVAAPGAGEGLARLLQARPDLATEALTTELATHERLFELDRRLSQVNDFELQRLAADVRVHRGQIDLQRVLS